MELSFITLRRSRPVALRAKADARCVHRGRSASRRVFHYLLLAMALGWSLGHQQPADAAEPPPGADVASIHAWLLQGNPRLRAMQAEADAAEARILPAGALPDPMASIELREIDPDQRFFLPGNVGSTTYQVKQRFPLWGKRELSRDVARREAESVRFDRDAAALELLAQAEQAYVRYWHGREAVTVIDRVIALLEQVQDVAGIRYAVGMAAQQDSIRAQVERTVMQREKIERLAQRRQAMAALNAVLGRRADAPLAEPGAAPTLPVEESSLTAALQTLERGSHPAVQASVAMASAANRKVELQRRNRLPDITVGLGAMQRGDHLDGYELMFEMEIPFQQRARRERERESRLLEDAALARSDATRRDLEGELGTAWARWTGAREQRQLIETTLLTQSDANFRSALASYQVGEVDFGTLLEALREWQGADLARVDALRDELLGAAEVRAIIGEAR
ncbi:MAG: TolC family protein [Arenimonas sp.]|jgi:outer membrane protein TolC